MCDLTSHVYAAKRYDFVLTTMIIDSVAAYTREEFHRLIIMCWFSQTDGDMMTTAKVHGH